MLLSEAKEMLSGAADRGRLAHAYLIVGNPQGDAAQLAVHMAQKLTCEEPNAPCGKCGKCRQIAEKTWCDVLWVYPMKKSRIISIDQMRDKPDNDIDPPYLLPWLTETSFAGGWKVAVIAEADRMNEAAANAFLKMLEEPPPQTLILLLTDVPQQLLPTIRSRCQRIDLAEPQAELPEPYLGQVLAAFAGMRSGGPLAAEALAARLTAILDELKDKADGEVKREIAAESDEIDLEKETVEARVSARYLGYRSLLLLAIQRWFRDMLVLRSGGDESSLNYPEYAETLRVRASAITLSQALANTGFVEDIARQLQLFLPEMSVFSYWLDRMAHGLPEK